MKILTLLLVMALVGPASAADSATVAVMPLRSINVPQYVTEVLDSTLAVAVNDAGDGLRVLSANDINAMLGVERMKDAVGCDDVSCAVDIGGALNAELIVTGSIGKLGNKLTINLVLVNIAETSVEARVQETIRDDENMYQDGVRGATQRLLAGRSPLSTEALAERPSLQLFATQGLSPLDHEDFMKSNTMYEVWAARRNQESVVLEVAKWVATAAGLGLAYLGGFYATDHPFEFDDAETIELFVGGLAMIPPLWIVDLLDIGSVPDVLPAEALGAEATP